MNSGGYYDFFGRGRQFSSSDWEMPIGRPRIEDARNGKLGQLHRDVFDHHHLPESAPQFVKRLIVQKNDAARIIALDNLTDYYLNSDLPAQIPIYESPDLHSEDPLRRNESLCSFEEFFAAVTDIPFSPANVPHGRLGGNRVTYLFGNVGTGKSFLCARVIAALLKDPLDHNEFRVIPIGI